MFCENCGTKLTEDNLFCPECGEKVQIENVSEEPVMKEVMAEEVPNIPEKKPAFPKKYLIAGIGAAAVLVVACLLFVMFGGVSRISMLGGGKSKIGPLLYLKDNELNGVLKKNKTYVVSDGIYSNKDNIYDPSDSISSYQQVQITEDGKYIFYPRKKYSERRFDLYRREYGKEKAEEIKVGSDISSYYVLDKNRVFYIKNAETNKLYFHDLKKDEKEPLSSDVNWFRISEDHKYVLWKETNNEDARLFVRDTALKNDEIRIAANISNIDGISKDFKKIVYRKDDKLYVTRDFGKDDKKEDRIASSVTGVNTYFSEDGKMEIYFTVNKDDAADDDGAWKEEEYYYSDETKKTELILKEGVLARYFAGAVMLYFVSDADSTDEVEDLKEQMFYKGKATTLDIDFEEYNGGIFEVKASEKKQECYLVLQNRTNRKTEYTLFKTGFKSDGKLEMMAEGFGYMEQVTDDGIYYMTELSNGTGELYFNDKKADSDVKMYSARVLEKGGVMYLTDPNNDGSGTLYQYKKGDPEKIADDVADYVEQANGGIAFLSDYNFSRNRGDLKLYEKGKVIAVDSDVTCIIQAVKR